MIDNTNPTQRLWWYQGLRDDIRWLFNHRNCRVVYPSPHNRAFHFKMILQGIRYFIGCYIKLLGMRILGEKVTYHIEGKPNASK